MSKIKGGLLATPKDKRDYKVGALFNLPTPEELPADFSLDVVSIKNQDLEDYSSDFCSAYITAGISEIQEGIELWPDFNFAASKYISGNEDGWGQNLRDAFAAPAKYGSVPQSLAVKVKKPRYFSSYPQVIKDTARQYKKQTYLKVSPTNGMDAFDTIRATIYRFRNEKRAVGFGVDWGWSPKSKIIDTIKEGSGHALYTIGWKTIENQPYLTIVNSYGDKVGDKGLYYFSRKVINHYYAKYGAFTLVDLPREDVEYMLQNGIKSEDNWIIGLLKVVKSFFYSPVFTDEEKEFLIKQTTMVVQEKIKEVINPREKLLIAAKEWLGKDASPDEKAPDDLACAESVSNILRSIYPDFPIIISTAELRKQLNKDTRFKSTLDIKPGCILVSPTGSGNGTIPNGHTGIFLTGDRIASNSSKSGLWEDNYSLDEWIAYYRDKGGFPLYVYEPSLK